MGKETTSWVGAGRLRLDTTASWKCGVNLLAGSFSFMLLPMRCPACSCGYSINWYTFNMWNVVLWGPVPVGLSSGRRYGPGGLWLDTVLTYRTDYAKVLITKHPFIWKDVTCNIVINTFRINLKDTLKCWMMFLTSVLLFPKTVLFLSQYSSM